ncbi:MAG: Rhodanese protein [uncultured bacterium]|nr:MAG: Rhodanese protein [uncultured bacterium]
MRNTLFGPQPKITLLDDDALCSFARHFQKKPERFLIIDVRDRNEQQERIAGSLNLPREEIANWSFSEKDRNKTVVIHCKSGRRTAFPETIAAILSLGFKAVYSMAGGIEQWKRLGFDVESSSKKLELSPR